MIAVLAALHWKKLMLLDLDAMPKAKLRSKKAQLIEERLKRRRDGVMKSVNTVTGPAMRAAQKRFEQMYRRLVAMERRYRHGGLRPQTQEDKEKTRQKISQLMEEGTRLFKEEKYADAEQMFLDIIRLNSKEVEAYEYLGEIYTERREYEEAIESLAFAKQLNPKDDRIAYDLGVVYERRGDLDTAKRYYKEAVKLAPNNPRNLNGLLQIAIELKDKPTAERALNQLKEVNPENQKLAELGETVAGL